MLVQIVKDIRRKMSRTKKTFLIISGILSIVCAFANIFDAVPNQFKETYKFIMVVSYAAFISSLFRLRKKPN